MAGTSSLCHLGRTNDAPLPAVSVPAVEAHFQCRYRGATEADISAAVEPEGGFRQGPWGRHCV